MIHTGTSPDELEASLEGRITLVRANAARRAWEADAGGGYFLITAGSKCGNGMPICQLVKNWLCNEGVSVEQVVTPDPASADNSISEVKEAVRLLKCWRLEKNPIYVCSSTWHIEPRLRLIYSIYGYELADVRFVHAGWQGFSLLGYFRELGGTIQVFRRKTGPRYVPL